MRSPGLGRFAFFQAGGEALVQTHALAPAHGFVGKKNQGGFIELRAVGIGVLADDFRLGNIAQLPQPRPADGGVILLALGQIVQQRGSVDGSGVKRDAPALQIKTQLVCKRGDGAAVGSKRGICPGGGEHRQAQLVCQLRPRYPTGLPQTQRAAFFFEKAQRGVAQRAAVPGKGGNGTLVADDGNVALALTHAAQYGLLHPCPEGLAALRSVGQQGGVFFPRGIQRRIAGHDLAERKPVPDAHVLLLQPRHDPDLPAERPRCLDRADKTACKDCLHAAKLVRKGQPRGLDAAETAQREITPPSDAPALAERDVRHRMPDENDAPAHSSSPKQASNSSLACRRSSAE